ncbi:hypothetical protein GCM10023175_04530 [Pseudonocardia xishanensis]|uniref:4Fe-4S Wbl-type domain-containing protein n=1 Tax=Pseudonocardia xishanensis TaxID=630995 RepID=A0ABP8RF72_9PSEU
MSEVDWRDSAACADEDPELFFPVIERGEHAVTEIAAAKEVCARCPVLMRCRAWARRSLPYGIAGGLTADERRELPVPAEVLKPSGRLGPPVLGDRREVAAAGRLAIQRGARPAEVAAQFAVTRRTATRWAAQVRAQSDKERGAENHERASCVRSGR